MAHLFRIALAFTLALLPRLVSGHEFWLEAQDYQVRPEATIHAGLYNGQNFHGVELAWFEGRIDHAAWALGAAAGDIASRSGNRPAIALPASGPGLLRLVYQSTPSTVTYTDWDTFRAFAETKGNAWAIARHRERGLPETGFAETYTRFAKALVAVGDGAGSDRFSGMEAELVALSNPYVDPPGTPFSVEMRYRGQPLPGRRIDIFEKDAATGKVLLSYAETDSAGQALVPLTPGRRYLLDAVVLREAAGDPPWQSLWASLTFEAPR